MVDYNPINGKRTHADKTAEGAFAAPDQNDWALLLQKTREFKRTDVK
jgi:hypothetical protein